MLLLFSLPVIYIHIHLQSWVIILNMVQGLKYSCQCEPKTLHTLKKNNNSWLCMVSTSRAIPNTVISGSSSFAIFCLQGAANQKAGCLKGEERLLTEDEPRS